MLTHFFPILQITKTGFFDNIENIAMVGIICQLAIAIAILKVWVIRYKSIVADFKEFNLPDWLRNLVGASKLSLCIVLIAGIWINIVAIISSIAIAVLMIGAIFAHYYAKHSFKKSFEAIVVLILCIIVVYLNMNYHYQSYYVS